MRRRCRVTHEEGLDVELVGGLQEVEPHLRVAQVGAKVETARVEELEEGAARCGADHVQAHLASLALAETALQETSMTN